MNGFRKRKGRAGLRFLPALLLLLLSAPLASAGERRVLLVLRPELSARQLFETGSPLAPLLPRAAIGLMNAAVPGPKTPASAYLTLGAGHRVAAGPLQEPIRFPSEPLEGGTALAAYKRRLGPPRASTAAFRSTSLPALVHPEWAAFLNRARADGASRAAAAAGALSEALRPHGGTAWLGVGAAARDRWGALAVIDQSGIVPAAAIRKDPDPAWVRRHLRSASLVVLELPGDYRLDRLAVLLVELAREPALDLLLVSAYPRPGPTGEWDSLPPLLAVGPSFAPGVLTSATTRTPGLVANIDLAPTLLHCLSVSIPVSMSGRPMRSEPGSSPDALLRFAETTALAQRAVVPLGIAVGAVAVGALLLSLAALALPARGMRMDRPGPTGPATTPRQSERLLPRLAHGAVLTVAATPLALLLAPVAGADSIVGLGVSAAVVTAGLLLLLHAVPIWRRQPLAWLFLITALVLAVDVLLGCRLIPRSPLSVYAVAGIRFYGLGNEYMGVLVGTAILGTLAFEAQLSRYRWLQGLFYLALLLLIGSPLHGANFGGALTAAAGFSAVLAVASGPGRPLRTVGVVAVSLVLAGALFLTWDALRPEGARSHIGDFARAIGEGGWPAAAALVEGKIRMALRLAGSGYALVPLIGVAPLLGLWYHGAGRWLYSLLARRSEFRAASIGALVASWTALLANDSGISPWMFITVALLAVLIDEQLREHL